MKINAKEIAKLLIEQTDGVSKDDCAKIVKDTISLLAKKKLIFNSRTIIANIHKEWKAHYGISSVKIVSAHQLTSVAKNQLNDLVAGADLYERVEPQLIGGAIIRVDDTRLDGSITGSLQRLKTTLMK